MIVFSGIRVKNQMFSSSATIILASGSRYRQALLSQIGLNFIACPADVDETVLAHEAPDATAARLARAKALTVASRYRDAFIIGSDQVATIEGRTAFSKPGGHAEAMEQLKRMSGQTVFFHTAVCLLNAMTSGEHSALVSTEVKFRRLSIETIDAYLRRDQPYDCAGSAKIEGLGIALVERVSSDDPSALMGLPLIALIDLLGKEGIRVL